MNYFQFKNVVAFYRRTNPCEITNYALRHNYIEWVRGNKTALVQKIERKYNKPINEILNFNKSIEVVPTKPQRADDTYGTGVDYRDMSLLEKILHPSLNGKDKTCTYRRAFQEGKLYVILNCDKHGRALHRITVRDHCRWKNNYSGCCLHCRSLRSRNSDKRIQDLKDLVNVFLQQSSSQPAS